MNVKALVEEFQAIKSAVEAGSATSEQISRLGSLREEIQTAQKAAADLAAGDAMIQKLGAPNGAQRFDDPDAEAKSLGAHLAKHIGPALRAGSVKSGGSPIRFETPEFKAATDTVLSGSPGVLTEQDVSNRVVGALADRFVPTVADLFAQGTMNGTSLKYFQETAAEGAFTTVAENGLKPQLSMGYTPVTESLTKIAGFIKESDEFVEDLGFLASVTNGRLLRKLAQAEEAQLVSGNGTAPNLRGLLNRTGLVTVTVPATSAGGGSILRNVEELFRAAMTVQNTTGLIADGIVINPADYERIRLLRDTNGQFYGGGPFMGQYGVGGMAMVPPLWGIRTVVSSAVAAGTAVVGAFGTAAMLFRKGGVRVEVANQNESDFIYNRITIRAEERLGLAVYVPQAFVRVDLYVSG